MHLKIQPKFQHKNFSVMTILLACLGLFPYSTTTLADTFNGPTELSSQEFKELTINGPARLNKIKAGTLTVNGPINFNELKVSGDTKVEGPFSGEDGEFSNLLVRGPFWGSKLKLKNLKVEGDAALEDFSITGNIDVNGPLKVKNGSCHDISSAHTPIALYNVKVNNINVKKNSDTDKSSETNASDTNEIKLAGDTVVSGNITFDSGDGIVFIRDKTVQFKGKIIGGKLKDS